MADQLRDQINRIARIVRTFGELDRSSQDFVANKLLEIVGERVIGDYHFQPGRVGGQTAHGGTAPPEVIKRLDEAGTTVPIAATSGVTK